MEFIGRYQIKQQLGQGGMATVFLAYDPQMKREVAIKVLPAHLMTEVGFRNRFIREAEIIASLEHGNIVPVYDFGEEAGRPFLVMRLMPGGSLADRLNAGPMSPQQAQLILKPIASALDKAHAQGIIHRDLKPANILFDKEGQPYLSDFGIAKLARTTTQLTSTGGLIGTPAYMSPEQVQGMSNLDGRSDIYSLGIVLFEMLTGRIPFSGDTPFALAIHQVNTPLPNLLSINPHLPAGTDQVIRQATAKDRNQRYFTASQMANVFEMVVEGRLPEEPTDSKIATFIELSGRIPMITPETPPQNKSRSGLVWALAGIIGVGFMVLIAIAGIILVRGNLTATPTAIVLFITATPQPALATQTPLSPLTNVPQPQPPTDTDTPDPTITNEPNPTATSTPTVTPTTVVDYPLLYTGRDGVTMRLVPAGEFLMGSTDDQIQIGIQLCQDSNSGDVCAFGEFANEMPQHLVYLDAFYMGETEITNEQYRACVNAGRCSLPNSSSGRYLPSQYYNVSSYANYPVVWVSWYDATDYCTWAGGRLPSEAEWEKAARGPNGQLFPWGNSFDPNKTNTQEGGGDVLRPVGQYPAGASPYGLLDMVGSVWEWVQDWFDPDYYTISPDSNPFGPSFGEEKVLRGSSYSNHAHYARVSNRGLAPPSGSNGSSAFRGFRCVVAASEVIR